MQIFDIMADHKSRMNKLSKLDEAYNIFVSQKNSIDAIANTNWFKEIKAYWQSVLIACNDRLRTVTTDNIQRTQWELELATWFLSFLDNIQSADISPDEEFLDE